MKILQLRFLYGFVFFCQLVGSNVLYAQKKQEIKQSGGLVYSIKVLEDKDGRLTINNISNQKFQPLLTNAPNYGLTNSVYWFKIDMINHTNEQDFLFKIQNATISNSIFYTVNHGLINTQVIKNTTPLKQREFNSQYPLFKVTLLPDSALTCYLRISSNNVMDLPMSLKSDVSILDDINLDQWFFGIYSGIILIMFLYNIFIYLTVKDDQYLYYVFYILVVGLTQACLKGYAVKFLWPNNEWLIRQAPHIITACSGIFSILFTFNFLHVRQYAHKVYIVLNTLIVIYFVSIAVYLSGGYIAGQKILQANTSLVSVVILSCGFYTYKKGYKPALFFNISWSFFLGGVIIYILKDAGVLPVNNFTSNAILIGSGLEATLLSFALADKINIYKKEKERSQEETVRALQENERIIREQNVILETKVNERTLELKAANEELNEALEDLKQAQTQLVESEKMASLGQLTAGIAHEINNPINFVTSNVNPLKRDVGQLLDVITSLEELSVSDLAVADKQKRIDELKEEMDFDYLKVEISHLLNGIHEGASRTAEIVKGLRIFSRVDEDDLKRADINAGLDSTLVIVNNLLNNKIKVTKNYADLPLIECYPGKLNQVFLNLLTNAIHAIKSVFGDNTGGELTISTYFDADNVFVKITDNGTGMDADTQKKIFEPFFTTKEVGEGTGLGMSIAYNTIKKHNGQIFVESAVGEGTTFILELPIVHKIQAT
ncbi:histidine kinase [Pedobacter sp. BS3]|uniref:sensor histidine kinase n=1 Tax=Pedobacter sp. BS3 TaxID=2567937 RepID=UPI0011ECB668|nr:7TM diverse intracellular signaling domain-containing protein [Pedobacter sp. BS3]TZF82582.1 histidine kinase [Pedobacter sp. BS3]